MNSVTKPHGFTDREWNAIQCATKGPLAYFKQISKMIHVIWAFAATFALNWLLGPETEHSRWPDGSIFWFLGVFFLALECYDYSAKRKLAQKLGLI